MTGKIWLTISKGWLMWIISRWQDDERKQASKQIEERMKEKKTKDRLLSSTNVLLKMLLFSDNGLLKSIMTGETESH